MEASWKRKQNQKQHKLNFKNILNVTFEPNTRAFGIAYMRHFCLLSFNVLVRPVIIVRLSGVIYGRFFNGILLYLAWIIDDSSRFSCV